MQPGETYAQAARREVFEETGIRDVTIGRCVWTQEKLVADPSGNPQLVIGRFFVARVAGDPAIHYGGHEPLEASTVVGHHWLTHDEIIERERTETFVPPGLGTLLGDVLRGVERAPVSLTVAAETL